MIKKARGAPVVAEFPPPGYEREQRKRAQRRPLEPSIQQVERQSVEPGIKQQKPSIVDSLRWQPVVKGSSWKTVPDTIRQQMLTLAALDPASFELEALVRNVDEDTLLNVTWAERTTGPSPDVIGWAIANVWPTTQGSECVILVFLHPDYNFRKVHDPLIRQLIADLSGTNQSTLVTSETVVNVSRRDRFIDMTLARQGFETVNAILP